MYAVIMYLYPAARPEDFIIFNDNGINWIGYWNSAKLGSRPTQAQIDAATIIVQAQQAKAALNAPIMAQIAALEATVTQRRIREHLTGANTVFIPGVDAQIATLRIKLV